MEVFGRESHDNASSTRGFTALSSKFNCVFMGLTLARLGSSLPTEQVLLCWSILCTEAVTYYAIMLCWRHIETAGSQGERPPSDMCRAGAVFFKVGMSVALIVTSFYHTQGFGQRETLTLYLVCLSIIFLEGLPQLLLVREEFESLMQNPWRKVMEIGQSIIEGYNWRTVIFLIPSVFAATITTTGIIVLGGNMGNKMPESLYWVTVSMIVVNLMAEGIHRFRFDYGELSLSDAVPDGFSKRHCMVMALRLGIGGFLWYWVTQQISQKSYMPANMGIKDCEQQCQERSEMMIILMAALTGLQAAATVTIPLCSFLLGPRIIPFIFLFAILMLGCLILFIVWPIAKFLHILKAAINASKIGLFL